MISAMTGNPPLVSYKLISHMPDSTVTKLHACFSYLPSFWDHFESLAFSLNRGDKAYTKAAKQDVFSQFFKGEEK